MTGHSQQGSLIDRFRVKAVVDQLISTHSHLSSSPSTTVGGSQRFADANAVASLHIRAQHCIVTGPMNLPVPVDQNKLTGFQSRVTRRPLLLWWITQNTWDQVVPSSPSSSSWWKERTKVTWPCFPVCTRKHFWCSIHLIRLYDVKFCFIHL